MRLGVLLGLSESNLYNEQQRVQNAYGAGTGAAAGQQVVTSVIFKDGPKWTERQTAALTVDFKATPKLILSLNLSYNGYEMFAYNRLSTLTTGANQLAGSNLLTIRTATGAANMNNGNGNINKRTMGYTIAPKFEYRWRSFTFDGAYSASVSRNTYGALRNGMAGNAQVNAVSGLTVVATRPGADSSAWQVVQTGGLDWADFSNYKNPRVTDDIRYVYNEVTNATLNAKWNAPFRWPTFFKFGAKRQERITNADNKGTTAEGVFEDVALGLSFRGRYAVVTADDRGECSSLYVGEGTRIRYRDCELPAKSFAYAEFSNPSSH